MDGRDQRRGARELTTARVRLDPRRPYKPLDVGNGIVSGSLTPSGRWLELGIAHPRHGRVVLTDAPPFAGARRLDQPAVRAYRSALASPERRGFGLGALDGRATAFLVEDSLPLAVHLSRAARLETLTFAPAGRAGIVQIVRIEARRALRFDADWTGSPRLARAAYTQLTAGGPLGSADEDPLVGRAGNVLFIEDRALRMCAAIALPPARVVPAGRAASFAVAIALHARRRAAIAEAIALAREGRALMTQTTRTRRKYWTRIAAERPSAARARRATAYSLDCAASSVGDAVAVLADHVILPLVWTRDAYYVCRALLALDPRGKGGDLTARFLRWCFEVAERPGGWWPRASLATGEAKDPVFQLDQQLYPLLLLEDHARLCGDDATLRRYRAERDAIVERLLRMRSGFGLVATAETPADDPIEAPYHFSSHVLLWRVLRDLAPARADELRAATVAHFSDRRIYAYAVRGAHAEGAVRYHDANDLPTVFAPAWGFCRSDDPRWRATVAFGWSRRNRAYFPGRYGGLGSVHTLHPWPLGDLQEIVIGRVLRDRVRIAAAEARLRAVRTWDGMLPEAYDERTGAVASRHWFAWPIALWALLEREPGLTAP